RLADRGAGGRRDRRRQRSEGRAPGDRSQGRRPAGGPPRRGGSRVIPFDDRGLLLGDGLFETILAKDGVLQRWPAHMARLGAGCRTLGLPAPDIAEAETLARGALWSAELQKGRAAVRLTLTAGSGGRGLDRTEPLAPRLFATAAAAPLPTGPARLITATVRRNAGSPASRLKTLAYLDNVLARREARAVGADEAAM